MAAPMQMGQQSLAAQGRAVKQTKVNYAGAAANQQAAAPAAQAPSNTRLPAPRMQQSPVQQAPQVRDRRFAQNQAAYQQGAPPAPGMMPLAYIPPAPKGTGRIGGLPNNTKGAMQGAGGNQAAWGGQQVSMAPQTLSALLGKGGAPGVQGTGGNQAAWGGQQVAANSQGMPVPPPAAADATGTVKTGTMYGKHESAPQQDQQMAGVAQSENAAPEGEGVEQSAPAWDPMATLMSVFQGKNPVHATVPEPTGTGGPTDIRTAGRAVGTNMGDMVGGIGEGLTPTTKQINTADKGMQDEYYGDVNAGLADQDAKANAQYGSPARAAAEQAAKDEMNLGINTQRDSQMRQLLGMQGRGGAVSQGQGNAINNSATMAQQAGERGLTQDSYERNRQATQDLLDRIERTNDRRKGMHDDIFTSNKDTLSLILGAVNPLSRVIPT